MKCKTCNIIEVFQVCLAVLEKRLMEENEKNAVKILQEEFNGILKGTNNEIQKDKRRNPKISIPR